MQTGHFQAGDRQARDLRHLPSLALGLFLLLCPCAFGDTVFLEDGTNKLEGTIQGVTEQAVLLKVPSGTVLSLARSNVKSISFSSPVSVAVAPAPTSAPPAVPPLASSAPAPAERPPAPSPVPALSALETTPETPTPAKPSAPLEPLVPTHAVASLAQEPVNFSMLEESPTLSPDRSFNGSRLGRPTIALTFPSRQNPQEFNANAFIPLSTFKGSQSHQLYAGIYYFDNKGTFWIRLPSAEASVRQVKFTLYGRLNKSQPVEPFYLQARYLDAYGKPIADSTNEHFTAGKTRSVEWFDHLEGISGTAGAMDVFWQVPENTKTIEFRVTAEHSDNHRLVGYLSNLVVIDP